MQRLVYILAFGLLSTNSLAQELLEFESPHTPNLEIESTRLNIKELDDISMVATLVTAGIPFDSLIESVHFFDDNPVRSAKVRGAFEKRISALTDTQGDTIIFDLEDIPITIASKEYYPETNGFTVRVPSEIYFHSHNNDGSSGDFFYKSSQTIKIQFPEKIQATNTDGSTPNLFWQDYGYFDNAASKTSFGSGTYVWVNFTDTAIAESFFDVGQVPNSIEAYYRNPGLTASISCQITLAKFTKSSSGRIFPGDIICPITSLTFQSPPTGKEYFNVKFQNKKYYINGNPSPAQRTIGPSLNIPWAFRLKKCEDPLSFTHAWKPNELNFAYHLTGKISGNPSIEFKNDNGVFSICTNNNEFVGRFTRLSWDVK